MKNIYIFIILIIYLSCNSCSDVSHKWVEYQSKDFGYKIEFPRIPSESSQSVDTKNGIMKLNLSTSDCQKDVTSSNKIYIVNFSEYPPHFFDGFTRENYEFFFYDRVQGMVNNQITNDGHLAESQVINFKGYEGREIKIVFNGGSSITLARFILKQNKLYILLVSTTIEKKNNPDIAHFFNSFEFLDEKIAEKIIRV